MKKVWPLVGAVAVLGLLVLVVGAMRAVPPYVPGKRTAPAEAPGVAATEHRLDVGGLKLLRRSVRPTVAGQAALAPVRGTLVIVHGLKDYSDRYADFANFLVKRGFRVETFDLRGHGDSEGDRVWVEHFEDYLTDLDKVMAEVRADSAGGPVFLFGHSMGGAIAVRWTETRKPELAGLLLSGAALKVDVPGALVAVTGFLGGVLPRARVFEIDDSKFSRSPGLNAAMAKNPLIYDGAGPARTVAELLATIDALRADRAKMTVPLLAMHGEADEVTPPSGSKELIELAASKDKTLKLYPKLVHDLMHEPEHEQVMNDIAGWMEARAPVAAPPPTPAAEPEPADPAP